MLSCIVGSEARSDYANNSAVMIRTYNITDVVILSCPAISPRRNTEKNPVNNHV